jgi:hypothetical protein
MSSIRVVAGPLIVGMLLLTLSPAEAKEPACDEVCTPSHCTFRGLRNDALGDAILALDDKCQLVVSGIGNAEDGVAQTGLGTPYMKTTLGLPNLSGSLQGTRVAIQQLGVVDGHPDQEVMLTEIVNFNDIELRHSVSCSAIEVEGYHLYVYDSDQLVHLQDLGPNPPVLIYPKVDMVWMACGIWPSGDVYTVFELGTPQPVQLLTASGREGPFVGDVVFVAALAPKRFPTLQTSIQNFFTNTGPVTFSSVEAGPLPGHGPPCTHDDPGAIGRFVRRSWKGLALCSERGTPQCPVPCPDFPTLEDSRLSPACYRALSGDQEALAKIAMKEAWGADRCALAPASSCEIAQAKVIGRLFWRYRKGIRADGPGVASQCSHWLREATGGACGGAFCARIQSWVHSMIAAAPDPGPP